MQDWDVQALVIDCTYANETLNLGNTMADELEGLSVLRNLLAETRAVFLLGTELQRPQHRITCSREKDTIKSMWTGHHLPKAVECFDCVAFPNEGYIVAISCTGNVRHCGRVKLSVWDILV